MTVLFVGGAYQGKAALAKQIGCIPRCRSSRTCTRACGTSLQRGATRWRCWTVCAAM